MQCPSRICRNQGRARSRAARRPASRCRLAQLARLFEPPLDADAVRRLLDDIARDWAGAQGRAGAGRLRLALPGQAARSSPISTGCAGEAAALFARGHGNPGDHRLSATRDPRRHRGDPRRRRVHQRHQDARGPAMDRSGRSSRNAGPSRRSMRRPSAFLDDLGLRSIAELPPLAELDASHLLEMPDAPTKAAEAPSRAREPDPRHRPDPAQPSLALQQIAESLPPPRHKRSTDEVFNEPQRLHKVLASLRLRLAPRDGGDDPRRAHHREPRAGRRRPEGRARRRSAHQRRARQGALRRAARAHPDVPQARRRDRHARRSRRARRRCSRSCRSSATANGSRRAPRLQHRGPAAVHQFGRAREQDDASALRGRARIRGARDGTPHATSRSRRCTTGIELEDGPAQGARSSTTAAATRTARTTGTTSC